MLIIDTDLSLDERSDIRKDPSRELYPHNS